MGRIACALEAMRAVKLPSLETPIATSAIAGIVTALEAMRAVKLPSLEMPTPLPPRAP